MGYVIARPMVAAATMLLALAAVQMMPASKPGPAAASGCRGTDATTYTGSGSSRNNDSMFRKRNAHSMQQKNASMAATSSHGAVLLKFRVQAV
jgi:hypothetical protein